MMPEATVQVLFRVTPKELRELERRAKAFPTRNAWFKALLAAPAQKIELVEVG